MLSHIVGIIHEFERNHGRRPQLVYLNQRHLAELMLGIGDPARISNAMGTASLIAPEPFRSIGFQIVSAIESRKAGLEA